MLCHGVLMSDADPAAAELFLDSLHRELGARMVSFAGYAMPIQFEGIIAEHRWTRAHAGLFDVSHMGQLEMPLASEAALEGLLPADVSGLRGGVLRYSLLLNDDGGILDDLMLTRRAAEFYMVVNGASKHGDIAELRAAGLEVTYRDDLALLALQGPQAAAVLERLAPGVGALSFMRAGSFELMGAPAWISRSGYTGEDGFEISVAPLLVEALARALLADPEVKPVGLGARDSLRLEAGLPLYGHDLDPETTPVQADLGFALSKRRREAGDFMGAEPILAERAAGATAKRVGLLIAGRQPVREGATVVDASGADIGRVTSGGFAPSVGAAIAMAYVPTEFATPGTTVSLSQRGKVHTATVTAMPFIPHRYVRQPKFLGGPK